ncbi:DNA gyrase subunit A, partial [Methanosalsum natronophilum]
QDTYNLQHRGGRGIVGMETKDNDFVENIFVASTHDYLLFFTNTGRVYCKKVYEIPQSSRQSRGKAIVNLLDLKDEYITTMIPITEFGDSHNLIMSTKKGIVKKCQLSEFRNKRKNGIVAISLDEDDELSNVILTDGSKDVIIVSRHGKAIRFKETDVRKMGRTARGVRGIRLEEEDLVVSIDVVDDDKDATLLTITEKGFGKRTLFNEYRSMRRGGKGIITIVTSLRNGPVVNIKTVKNEDEVMLTTSNGIVIRIPVKDIRVQGRNTKGVKIMNVRPEDKVVGVARIKSDE